MNAMQAADIRTLQLLREHAQAVRDAAVLALQRAEQHLGQAQAQAQALSTYRLEYRQRWSTQLRQAAAIEVVHCYRSFMQRLDQAVEQQSDIVQRGEATVAQRRAERIAAETRVAAIERLIARRVHAQQRNEHRRDQRQTDEAAQRSGWQAASGDSLGRRN